MAANKTVTYTEISAIGSICHKFINISVVTALSGNTLSNVNVHMYYM